MLKLNFVLFFISFVMQANDFDTAEKYFKAEKYDLAKPIFEKILREEPSNYKVIEYLGDIAGAKKSWDDAIYYYAKLKVQFPKNADYWYKFGGATGMKAKNANKFSAMTMIGTIEDAFLMAAKLDPKHTNTRWALITLYLELPGIIGGSERKAQHYADDLLSFSKIDGLMAKGHIDEYFKRYKSAERYYRAGVNLTHSKTAYQRLITLYNKMKLPQKVILAQEESNTYNK
jgi:tetratricopeptide (TPR) repeat protein